MLQILTLNWATEPFVIVTRSCLYSRSHKEVLMRAKRNALLVVALALMILPLAIPVNAVVGTIISGTCQRTRLHALRLWSLQAVRSTDFLFFFVITKGF